MPFNLKIRVFSLYRHFCVSVSLMDIAGLSGVCTMMPK